MSETNVNSLASEVAAFEAGLRRQHGELQAGTRRQLIAYGVVTLFLLVYFAWAFARIAPFAEPGYLGEIAAEIAAGQLDDMVENARTSLPKMAPAVVRGAEDMVVATLPEFRGEFERLVSDDLKAGTVSVLETGDRVLVEELAKKAEARKLVALSGAPGTAPRLLDIARDGIAARPDVKAEVGEATAKLKEFRDLVKKLHENRNLTAAEQAERRFIQLLLARLPAAQEPVKAAIAVSTGKVVPAKAGKNK